MTLPVWEFRCQARGCQTEYHSNVSLNETIWAMQGLGWHAVFSTTGWAEKVFCPAHTSFQPSEMWLVECPECYWEEWFYTEEEAREEADEHEDCDCDYHSCRVLSPAEQEERDKRRKEIREAANRKREAEAVQERYVAFLIKQDQDNYRRLMQETNEPIRKYEIAHKTAISAVLVLIIILALITLAGCGQYSKQTEHYQDAPVAGANNNPADLVRMPDGFGNVATKCDHGNRIYVLFHNNNPYGSVAVVKGC